MSAAGPAKQPGRLVKWLEELLLGESGIGVVLCLGVGGQLIWLAFVLGAVELADAIAVEGVIVAVCFGILAVRIALLHERDLRGVSGRIVRVSDDLGGVSNKLGKVSESLQTKPIGNFPEYLSKISALIGRAEQSVTVMCDHPAYAIYSEGAGFDAYIAALKEKVARRSREHSFSVDLMFLAAEERRQLHRDQLELFAKQEEDWVRWRNSEKMLAFLKRAHAVCHPDARPMKDSEAERARSTLTRDQYVEELEAANEALLRHHFYGAHRVLLPLRDAAGNPQAHSRGPSIYFWMRETEAIFAIVPLGKKSSETREVAFETQDPSMIDALRGTFSRYGRDVVPFAEPPAVLRSRTM
jgi:hypothetical protein